MAQGKDAAIQLFTPDWTLPEGIQARFTGRQGGCSQAPYQSFNLGNHVGDQAQHWKKNRQTLLQNLPGATQIQWLKQIHGNDVVEACGGSVTLQADAVTTEELGLACAIMTADCLPVLFSDHAGKRVAAAHAGWRGLAEGVLLNTLACFEQPASVTAYLGPAIGFDAFEVGPEVRQAFAWASDACFQQGEGDRYYADLYQIAREQLTQAGVKSIGGGELCTYRQGDDFFSYRRDGVTGRQATVIWKR